MNKLNIKNYHSDYKPECKTTDTTLVREIGNHKINIILLRYDIFVMENMIQ